MKLHIELLPRSSWENNLRTAFKPSDWSKIRKLALCNQNGICHFCNQHFDSLDAHEIWEFNEANHIQKLVGIIGVCKKCHNTIHFGRAQQIGREEDAIKQFLLVNECDRLDFENEKLEAFIRYQRLSQIEQWDLDISWLKDELKFSGEPLSEPF